MGFWRKLLGFVAVAATLVTGAVAHGQLSEPKARNVLHNSNYCPHCLAAGGPGTTYAGGRTWPNSLHGVCGDPHNMPRDHEAGGKFATKKITGSYVTGQTIPIRITITAPHGGRFSFGLCVLPDKITDAAERALVTQACFDKTKLLNAEDGQPYWWFGKRPTGEYTMKFKLPPGVRCKRCVLQWHYETGNSCTIPGTPAQHVMSPNMVQCDKTGVMEEFWNCADISIGGGKPPKPTNTTAKAKAIPLEKYTNLHQPASGDGPTGTYTVVVVALLAIVIILASPLALAMGTGTGVLMYLMQPHHTPYVALLLTGLPRRRQRSSNFCLWGSTCHRRDW